MENKFLHDFMRRQASLIQSAIPEEKSSAPPAEAKAAPKKKKSKYGTADGKHPFGGDDMESRLATIIQEKPPKKDVIDYFRDRISELTAENM